MTEKEVRKLLERAMERAEDKFISHLLEQAKKHIMDKDVIINYSYYPDVNRFYITTVTPMTNIIWEHVFDVENGIIEHIDCKLAHFC